MHTFVPQILHVVEALTPAADAAGRASDWVSLKAVNRAWIVVQIDQGAADTIALTLQQATVVAGTDAKAFAKAVPIWSNLDCAASDTLVRRTDAVSYTTDAGVKRKLVIFAIDPAKLDRAGGFCCVNLTTGASNAANITAATFLLEMAYASATPPSAITD